MQIKVDAQMDDMQMNIWVGGEVLSEFAYGDAMCNECQYKRTAKGGSCGRADEMKCSKTSRKDGMNGVWKRVG